MKVIKNEDGIAIILALIMLLVMSVIAVAISFFSNIDYKMMQNYKRGQEAFLAAETCTREGRSRLELLGVDTLYFELQGVDVFDPATIDPDSEIVILSSLFPDSIDNPTADPSTWKGPMCRSGPRNHDSVADGPALFVNVPPPSKSTGRPPKNISLASGGSGGAALVPVTFRIVGKDRADRDKNDDNIDDLTGVAKKINTGKEIALGIENFIPGGASNRYD